MKIKQSKEWYRRMAVLEEGCDISAGKPIFYPPEALDLSTTAKPKRIRKPKVRTASASSIPAKKRRTTTVKSHG